MLEQRHGEPEGHPELAKRLGCPPEPGLDRVALGAARSETSRESRLLGAEVPGAGDRPQRRATREKLPHVAEVPQGQRRTGRFGERVDTLERVPVQHELGERLLAPVERLVMTSVRSGDGGERERPIGAVLIVVGSLSAGEAEAESPRLLEVSALDLDPDQRLGRERAAQRCTRVLRELRSESDRLVPLSCGGKELDEVREREPLPRTVAPPARERDGITCDADRLVDPIAAVEAMAEIPVGTQGSGGKIVFEGDPERLPE